MGRRAKGIILLFVTVIMVSIFSFQGQAYDKGTAEELVSIALAEQGNTDYTRYDGHCGAWCHDFVKWCSKQAGCEDIIPQTSLCSAGISWFESKGLYHSKWSYTPKPGDIWYSGGNHVGIVSAVGDGWIQSIEGNYEDVVYNRTIYLSDSEITGFGEVLYSDSAQTLQYGFDYPNNADQITKDTFLFQGWVKPDTYREIESVSCCINDGQAYMSASLYTRPDVPQAVAFSANIPVDMLNVGKNVVALSVNYKDGSAEIPEIRIVYRIGTESDDEEKITDGWEEFDANQWFYFKNGVAVTGWINDIIGWNGTWFNFGYDKIMNTGWLYDGGSWYYLESNGAMQTGWQCVDGLWYCLAVNGAMYENCTTPDGYIVDHNGVWVQ